MTTIYYLSTILLILAEYNWLVSPIERTNSARKFFELSKQFKGKKWNEYSEEYKSELKSRLWVLLIFLWILLGLFTFQWLGFLLFLVFNVLVIPPILKITRFSVTYTVVRWIGSLIGFSFGIFVIVNKYHLKIDLTQWILSIVN